MWPDEIVIDDGPASTAESRRQGLPRWKITLCIYLRPNCDCITCTSEATRPISKCILSFYFQGHKYKFFITSVNVRILRELFDAIRKGSDRFNRIVIATGLMGIRCPKISASVTLYIFCIHHLNYPPKLTGVFCWWNILRTLLRHNGHNG